MSRLKVALAIVACLGLAAYGAREMLS